MKTNLKKLLSLLLVCSLLISLAACGSSTDDNAAASDDKTSVSTEAVSDVPNEEATEAPMEPITITVGTSTSANGFPESEELDYVRNLIYERTMVWIDLVVIDDYYTSLNMQLIGGTAPDFFFADNEHMQGYVSQGLIQEVTDWNDDIATVYDRIGAQYDNYTLYVDGVQHAFPKAEAVSSSYNGIWMREDILTSLGANVPTTVSELYDLCVNVKNNDPTGLITFALSGRQFYPYNIIAGAYGTQLGNYVTIVDGKVSNTVLDANMPAALTKLNEFYSAGLISSNTFNAGSGDKEIRNGVAFAGSCQWSTVLKQAYMDNLDAAYPGGKLIGIDMLQSEVSGVEAVFGISDYNSNGGEKLTINADTSEEKIAALVRVLNYLATDEGQMLSWMGIEGTHWDYDANGNAYVIEGQADAINYVHAYQLIGRNDPEYLAVKFPEANDFTQNYLPTLNRLQIYNDVLQIPDTYYLDDLETYINDQLLMFVKGERPISEYDKFVQELYDVYDLQTYIDIATEQLGALGLLK